MIRLRIAAGLTALGMVMAPFVASADSDGVVSSRDIIKTLVQGNVGGTPTNDATKPEEAACRTAIGSCGSGEATFDAIRFELNSAELTPTGRRQVEQLGEALISKELGGLRVGIFGHTDATGDDNYNLTLSEQRAKAVALALFRDYGVEPARLESQGFGEAKLLLPFAPEAAENRRVEIKVLK